MIDFLLQYDLETHLLAFALGTMRLVAFAAFAPFMGSAVLNALAKSAVVVALYLVLHPTILPLVPAGPMDTADILFYTGLAFKEIFLGAVLGWLSGLVFWAIESAGALIDNQRGASMAQGTDIVTGEQVSPTASFLFQSTLYAFFASGTFAVFLGVLYGTYEIWPVDRWLPAEFFIKDGAALFFGERVTVLAMNAVLLSAPVVLACLFTDIALGLVNRFASQLNVYVLAMPIKSGLASFLLIFYFAILMTGAPERFAAYGIDVSSLRIWFQ